MPKVTLNAQFLKGRLSCPEGKTRIEFVCNQTPGFFAEVRAKSQGTATYYKRFRDQNGKAITIKLGKTTDTELDDARERARKIDEQLRKGLDPLDDLPKFQATMTYGEFFELHYLPHAKSFKRTARNDESMFSNHLKRVFGSIRLNQITKRQAQQFHRELKASGLSGSSCDHYLKLLRSSLNCAVDWELLSVNPLARVKLFKEDNRRERYLSDSELVNLLEVLDTYTNRPVCRIVLFLLATGCRLSEALRAQWKHVDLDKRLFTIPAVTSKSKRSRTIPLNDTAVGVLSRAKELQCCEYVFPNPATQKPYSDIKKSWYLIRKKAGLEDFRVHDLRHSFASFAINSGRSLFEVQQLLGHSSPEVTQRYSHLQQSTLLSASESASDAIRAAQTSNVPAPPVLRVVGSGKS
jgi:integrase